MGKAKQLTSEEIGKLKILKELGVSNRQIAKKLNRSECVIRSFLKDPENYGKKYKGRTKEALTAREKRLVLRNASNSKVQLEKLHKNRMFQLQ